MVGSRVIDKERLLTFADGKVSGFSRQRGECPEMVMRDGGQHPAPVVLARKAPYGSAEDVIFASRRVRQEAPALECIREPEDAAAVNAENRRELSEGDG